MKIDEKYWYKAGKLHARHSRGSGETLQKLGPLKHVVQWIHPGHFKDIRNIRNILKKRDNPHNSDFDKQYTQALHRTADNTKWNGKSKGKRINEVVRDPARTLKLIKGLTKRYPRGMTLKGADTKTFRDTKGWWQMHKVAKNKSVPMSNLVPGQRWLHGGRMKENLRVQKIRKFFGAAHKDGPIMTMKRADGKNVILDGHHRWKTAQAQGDTHMNVNEYKPGNKYIEMGKRALGKIKERLKK